MLDPVVESQEEDEFPFADSIDVSHIITEDDEPVDNLFSEKQQRLLARPLYASHVLPRPFVAAANVGVFSSPHEPPIVPDFFLSLGVEIAENWYAKEHRTYFMWEFGKPPDVVLEVVSNKKGNEQKKRLRYSHIGVQYYIIYDPQLHLSDTLLQVYELNGVGFKLKEDTFLDEIGIGLTLWYGEFEQRVGEWLRWYAADGSLLKTGVERAVVAEERAESAEHRANSAEESNARLIEQLRQLGIDPNV